MSDDKWLLTEAEVTKLLLDWPIGYESAIRLGAIEQLAKLRRLGWQEPKRSPEFLGDTFFPAKPIYDGGRTPYLWTKGRLRELEPCEVRVIEP